MKIKIKKETFHGMSLDGTGEIKTALKIKFWGRLNFTRFDAICDIKSSKIAKKDIFILSSKSSDSNNVQNFSKS